MSSIYPTTVPSKRLAESITGASTSFKLNSITGWDGNSLTSADFGSVAYAVFRNSAGTLMEIMEIDPTTITSASSPITINKRGLKFTGDLTTEVSANKLTWVKGDTIVELGTHVPQLLKSFVDIYDAQTIAGVKTFTSTPVNTGGNPTAANELATKAYVDLTATGTATTNKQVIAGTAGETLAAGNLVYLKTSDSRWWKADADAAGTSENIILGIAQGAGTAGNAITNGVLVSGLDTNQTGLSANTVYYVSNTAGAISSTPGTKEVTVGVATSTTSIHFFPRYNQQLTENQQDLIEQIEAGTDWYAASSTGNDSYAITITPPITAYVSGMRFRFKVDVGNTGAATLNVSGLGAKTIKKNNDQDLATGDIEAGQIVEVVYDGTNMQMVSQTAINAVTQIDTYNSSSTWTKPSGAVKVLVQIWGGGGSGAKGNTLAATGGGGGEYKEIWLDASACGATETVTVGAGGASVTTSGTSGNNGTASTFGSLARAEGGFGGISLSASDGAGGDGGRPYVTINGIYGAGVSAGIGQSGLYSAAGGGYFNATLTGHAGGNSYFGGAGGGGAGDSGQGAGGTSQRGGNGGAGAKNGNATAGSQPAGGGGAVAGTGNTGKGGDGRIIVTTFF